MKRLLTCACLMISACATQPLNTPSGGPEVTIRGKTQAEVMDALVAACAQNGLMIENQTASTVVCGAESNMAMQVMIGNAYGSTPQSKVQFATFKQGDAVKIIAPNAWNESSNGFGAVQRYPTTLKGGAYGQSVQVMLENIARSLGN